MGILDCACSPYYCCAYGGGNLSMNTVAPNPDVCQSTGGVTGDGGAGALSNALNTIGKWGTAVTGIVAGSKVQAAQIQAKAQTRVATSAINSTTIIVIVIAALIIWWLAK